MQQSFYLKSYAWEGNPQQLLLYSTKKTSSILIDTKVFHQLQMDNLNLSYKKILERLGMVVQGRDQERENILSFFENFNANNRCLNIIAVLNLDCNFACTYCFEEGIKGNLYMSKQTARGMLDFIKGRWSDNNEMLLIDFYGGEPLLSLDLIQYVSHEARNFAETRGAAYYYTLVTNGSLFTRKTAEKLVSTGLKSVKITLDGPPEIHNTSRPFRSGAGTFDTIISNIKDTCDLVKIGIGGNFNKDNYKRFALLLDYLEAEGITPDRIAHVKFDPIAAQKKNEYNPVEFTQGCASINETWLIEAETFLREEILKRGYKTSKPAPMMCMVEISNSLVINYDGTIYKCPAFIGNEKYSVGNIYEGVCNYQQTLKLGNFNNSECEECVYLPLCFGGCRYMSYVRDGNINSLDCRKFYFDHALERLLKQDIRYNSRR